MKSVFLLYTFFIFYTRSRLVFTSSYLLLPYNIMQLHCIDFCPIHNVLFPCYWHFYKTFITVSLLLWSVLYIYSGSVFVCLAYDSTSTSRQFFSNMVVFNFLLLANNLAHAGISLSLSLSACASECVCVCVCVE